MYNMHNMHNMFNTQYNVYLVITVVPITCIICITLITHITIRTMTIGGKWDGSHNAYEMLYTQNTYNTQHKVYWRWKVWLITC